jgi:hypothetical protein
MRSGLRVALIDSLKSSEVIRTPDLGRVGLQIGGDGRLCLMAEGMLCTDLINEILRLAVDRYPRGVARDRWVLTLQGSHVESGRLGASLVRAGL